MFSKKKNLPNDIESVEIIHNPKKIEDILKITHFVVVKKTIKCNVGLYSLVVGALFVDLIWFNDCIERKKIIPEVDSKYNRYNYANHPFNYISACYREDNVKKSRLMEEMKVSILPQSQKRLETLVILLGGKVIYDDDNVVDLFILSKGNKDLKEGLQKIHKKPIIEEELFNIYLKKCLSFDNYVKKSTIISNQINF